MKISILEYKDITGFYHFEIRVMMPVKIEF